jgi:hypothetical protein
MGGAMGELQRNQPGGGGNSKQISAEETQRRLEEIEADAICHQAEDLYTQVLLYSVAVSLLKRAGEANMSYTALKLKYLCFK